MKLILMRYGLWLWLFAGLCALLPTLAMAEQTKAHPLPIQLSVLADPDGAFTLAQAQELPFVPLKNNAFSAGYTRKVHWFAVTIPEVPNAATSSIVLEVHPTYLDHLWFYYRDAQGEWQEKRLGDHYPFAQRDVAYRGFALELPVYALDAPIYLRLQTTSSSVLNMNAWQSLADFQANNKYEYGILGAYYGILLVLLLMNAAIVLLTKDKIFLLYFIYLLASTVLTFSNNGLWAEFIFPTDPMMSDHLSMISVALVFITSVIFYEPIMRITRTNTPKLYWVNKVHLLLSVLILLSIWLNYYTQIMVIASNFMMLILGLWLIRSWQIWRAGQASFWLLAAHIATLLGGVVASLSLNGIIDGDFWVVNGFQVSVLGTMLALQIIMIQRIYHIYQAHLQAETRAEIAEYHRQQQESFLSMLTHELKTPLSIINMALANPKASERVKEFAMTSVQNINDIVDHCSHSQKLTHQNTQLALSTIRVLPLIRQLLDDHPPSHSVVWQIQTDDDEVTTDATYLRVILHNLLNNAAKYATPESDIRIRISRNATKLCISIDNDVQAHQLPDSERLYDAYYRSPSAQKVSGSGLGLFIVKSLVERLSGEILYQQNDQSSVSFTVCFQNQTST